MAATKEWHKFHHIKTKYGLTREQYESMVKKQKGRCKICREIMNRICIDHNHENNDVRDLLCSHCNTAIGLIKESISTAESMIAYFKKWGKR